MTDPRQHPSRPLPRQHPSRPLPRQHTAKVEARYKKAALATAKGRRQSLSAPRDVSATRQAVRRRQRHVRQSSHVSTPPPPHHCDRRPQVYSPPFAQTREIGVLECT